MKMRTVVVLSFLAMVVFMGARLRRSAVFEQTFGGSLPLFPTHAEAQRAQRIVTARIAALYVDDAQAMNVNQLNGNIYQSSYWWAAENATERLFDAQKKAKGLGFDDSVIFCNDGSEPDNNSICSDGRMAMR